MLADDDDRFRAYIRTLLAKDPSADLVGEAANGEAALELVRDLRPDLLLVDLGMPGLSGIETTRRALALQPDLKVIVITLHNDTRMVNAALEAGSAGYLLKELLDEELAAALAAVGSGEMFLSSGLMDKQKPPSPHPSGSKPESS